MKKKIPGMMAELFGDKFASMLEHMGGHSTLESSTHPLEDPSTVGTTIPPREQQLLAAHIRTFEGPHTAKVTNVLPKQQQPPLESNLQKLRMHKPKELSDIRVATPSQLEPTKFLLGVPTYDPFEYGRNEKTPAPVPAARRAQVPPPGWLYAGGQYFMATNPKVKYDEPEGYALDHNGAGLNIERQTYCIM